MIELTCCFETNLEHSRNFKIEKYKNVIKDTVKLKHGRICHIWRPKLRDQFFKKTQQSKSAQRVAWIVA